MKVDKAARWQAMWWIASLMASREGTEIPDPRKFEAEAGVDIYTDAAGGGIKGEKDGGMGGVTWGVPSMKKMMWTIFKWPQWILDEKESSLGVRFASKLSTLEGLGCLTQLAVGHKELKGLQVKIHCDNAGFVFAMSSGSSTCLYVATISKALHDLAQGLDIALRVVKTGRMSGPGERAADALSKGDMQRALLDIGTVKEKMPRRVPKTIVEWVSDPVPDPQLGHRILEELRGQEENMEWEKIRLTVSDVREAAVLSLEEGKRARVCMLMKQKREQQHKKRLRQQGMKKVAEKKARRDVV